MRKSKYIYLIIIVLISASATIYFRFYNTKTLYIVSSLPAFSSGPTKAQFRGIQMALEKENYKAGKYKINWISLDNSNKDGWTLELEKKNAETAIANKDVVAYFGPFNSGTAIGSMPILNMAGMLQITGSMTWPGLTKPGYGIGEPMKYYPRGERHFFRVVPNDSVQGVAAANYLSSIGVKSVAVIHDNGLYGKGVSSIFEQKATSNGISIKYTGVIEGSKTNIDVVNELIKANPDVIFFGSEVLPGIVETYSKLRSLGYPGIILGTVFVDKNIEKAVNFDDTKFYTIVPGKALINIKEPLLVDFINTYRKQFNEEPSRYALSAYQSISLILDAIKKSNGTRIGVLESFKSQINTFNGGSGPTIFDSDGDILENASTVYQMVNGKWVFTDTIII